MSSDPKPVGGQWHKAARGELSPPKGASEETLVPQLFTASVPDPRTVQCRILFDRPRAALIGRPLLLREL